MSSREAPPAAPDEASATPPADGATTDASATGAADTSDASPATGPRALAWIRADTLSTPTPVPALAPPLIGAWPRRRGRGAAIVVPIVVLVTIGAAYALTMLFWPLAAIRPALAPVDVTPQAAPVSAPAWPSTGEASVAVVGAGTLSHGGEIVPLASLTKLVTALVVLSERPLEPGEDGESFETGFAEVNTYLQLSAAGESSYPVPNPGVVTEREALAASLVGSSGNHTQLLVDRVFGGTEAYLPIARAWLAENGLGGLTIVDATGIGWGNTGSPEAVALLGQRAMENPVIAELVALPSVEVEGAGVIENTNQLIGQDGVVGLKTGTLYEVHNVLLVRDVAAGDETARIVAATLDQPDPETRWESIEALTDSVAAELEPRVAVPAGTPLGEVRTAWGAEAGVVTEADASLTLWNGASASLSPRLNVGEVGEETVAGASAGSLVVTGSLGDTEVEAVLDGEIAEPSAWWRLTNPLVLLGVLDWR